MQDSNKGVTTKNVNRLNGFLVHIYSLLLWIDNKVIIFLKPKNLSEVTNKNKLILEEG